MSAAGISSPTQSRLLRWLAYAAAATLCGISALANLKFGMSLGADRVDQMALGGASVAVDVLKAALPLLVLNLWSGRYRILAVVSAVLWIGCLSWSGCSAIGFAVDSRSQVNADRTMQRVASQGSIATIGRAERQLTAIGTIRPVDVVKANLAATNVPAPVWARTKECTAITLPESYAACAAVVSLRRELAVAEVAERLEQSVAAGHAELRADKAGQAEIDPQVTALARLAGVDEFEHTHRTGITPGRSRGSGLCTGLYHRRLGHQGPSRPFYGPSDGNVSTGRGSPSHGSLAPQSVQAAQRRDRHPEHER